MNPSPLVVEFTKMEGAGNDFVVVDNRFFAFGPSELSRLAVRLCNRRTGVGGDGLLALDAPEAVHQHFRMRYYNADGSLGTMCGNGARCLAAFAQSAGIHSDPLLFGSDAGDMRARVIGRHARGVVEVEIVLPAPRDYRPNGAPPVPAGCLASPVGFVWTGTEHVVYETAIPISSFPVADAGPAIRSHEILQPAGANVNFVERMTASEGVVGRAAVRTFEKGVEAETLACGTGAVAVAYCGLERGWWPAGAVDLLMQGGTLRVTLAHDGEVAAPAILSGPTRVAFRGSADLYPGDY